MFILLTVIFFIIGESDGFHLPSRGYTAYADSSILEDSTTYLYGNVRFTHKDLKITSLSAIIIKEKVIVRDSVRILFKESREKEDVEILGDLAEYFWDGEIKLYDRFVVRKKCETLTAKTGKYLDNKLWLYKNVIYVNDEEKAVVLGDEGFYNFDTNYGMITQGPKFEVPEDSIEISGDTIKLFGDTLTQVIHNAILKLGTISCFAESLAYFPKNYEVLLYGEPRIVSQTDSLGGKQIKIILQERKIERLLVEGEVEGKRWKF